MNNLNHEQFISFESYEINYKLRNEFNLSNLDTKMIMNLDNALKKMPTFEGTVSRSLYFGNREQVEEFMKILIVGQKVLFKEYISTTSSQNLYTPEGELQIFIQNVKKGRNISYFNEQEAEILYERDSTFMVMNVVARGGKQFVLLEEC